MLFSDLKTAVLTSTPGLFTWNMCTVCTAGEGKKDNNTVMLCLAYHPPITFHMKPTPANHSAASWTRTANRWERGPLMQRRCNRLLPNNKVRCESNSPPFFLQNNTTPHSKSTASGLYPVSVFFTFKPSLSGSYGRLFKHYTLTALPCLYSNNGIRWKQWQVITFSRILH